MEYVCLIGLKHRGSAVCVCGMVCMCTLDEPADGWQYILSAVEVPHSLVVNAGWVCVHVICM